MRKSWIVLGIALAVATPVAAGAPRILEGNVPVNGLETVQLDAGVGDIEITAIEGADEVSIEVQLKPRRGGFFSSMKKAQSEVDEAELRMDVSKGVLRLEIETESDDRHFEEKWIIEVPSRLMVKLEHGVGDVTIRGVTAGVELDSGVGDVEVVVPEGDVNIDLGVGTAVVRAPAAVYGTAEAAGGVGSARLEVKGEEIESGGFVSKSASWSGDGMYRISVAVGVGDAVIELE